MSYRKRGDGIILGATIALSTMLAFMTGMALENTVDLMNDVHPKEPAELFIDPGTKCHYLITKGAIGPRLGPDGLQICNGFEPPASVDMKLEV